MLHVKLFDEHGAPCCANVGVYQNGTRVWRAYVGETGDIPLEDGVYNLIILRGKQYWPLKREITVVGNKTVEYRLERVHDPKLLGFYAFEAHTHISRARLGADAVMDLEKMSVRARGEDWNVYFAGEPYDGENHLHVYQSYCPPIGTYRKYYRALLDRLARPDYLVDPGGEFIKYRYGHIVLANFDETPPVDEFRDPLYHAYERDRHVPCTQPPPFINVPPSRALKMFRDENSFAFFAHPTSWWRQERNESFVTNIASTCAFDGLTGMVDAIVVEGYGADKPWYRGVWYALLDAGYRMTGIAETDTCGDDPDHLSGKRLVEPFRTYARCDRLGLDDVSAAVRAGDCFATSGPLLDLTLDGARPGSVLPYEVGRAYALHMQGWRCYEGNLKEFEVVVNGKTLARIAPDENGMADCHVTLPGEGYVLCILRDDAGNVAVGNPIYVRNTTFINDRFRAHVSIDVMYNGRGANGFFTTDESEDPVVFDTRVVCDINPMSRVYVTVDGKTQVYEPFFDEQLQAYFRYAYNGEFLRDAPMCKTGEVPAFAYHIPQVIERLKSLTASMDFGVSDEVLKALRQTHRFETGAPSPLLMDSPFQSMPADDAALPDPRGFHENVPRLYWSGQPHACLAMARAFEIAGGKILRPDAESGLPRRLLYTEFADAFFMWGISFVTMFGKYASHLFPFIEMLDNFYAKQHADGFICRQIDIHSGNDQFDKHDPSSTGPNILALAEWQYYQHSGDADRLRRVYAPLLAYHRWLRKHRTWQNGGYFSSGWGCGMDNLPRGGPNSREFDHGHLVFIDTTAQQALNARILLQIAQICGTQTGVRELTEEYEQLAALINGSMWNEADGFYEDTDRHGHPTGVMHIGAYWALLAGVVPKERLSRFTAPLLDEKAFCAPMGTRSLTAAHPDFAGRGGDYWRGGVWCITEYMLMLGLQHVGLADLAHSLSYRHVQAVAQVFADTGTFWESYDPTVIAPGRLGGQLVRNEFIGFSGVAPIAMAIEGVLGITVEAGEIRWQIRRTEPHGVENLYVQGQMIDLWYQDGVVTVRCQAPLRLTVNLARYEFDAGEHLVQV